MPPQINARVASPTGPPGQEARGAHEPAARFAGRTLRHLRPRQLLLPARPAARAVLLPDAVLGQGAHAEVSDDFDPRRDASSRVYRYIMSGEQYDISRIRSASKILAGEHDFSNFCSKDEDKSTVRDVKRIDVRVSGALTKIDIEANSFLWNMVRKMVTALTMVGSLIRDEAWLKQMLEPESYEEGLEPAQSYGLTLMEVKYPMPIQWVYDSYSLRRASEKVQEYLVRHRVMAEVMQELVPKD